ncbi:MAG: 16S rRNA (adenine(1518)-N(6)/adenine(1519)-N(6))-dimethyltransferase RsmA [Clostridia bacterium]|jgi:16S rRNA (adenine1518-N6/adenine1519-N6)-dimethyltransferase|nr:16S rRNA (adenine(1518)-N(6)/adenine(1519)-N(6))-dimethyltransferase RsmA [Clostridia bacterium]
MPTLTDISTVRDILSRHGFSFSKALGQNFLINPSVCPRMAAACQPEPDGDFAVLEIGPGLGVLTKELAQVATRVISIELDTRLLPILQETLAEYPNVTIVSGDVMKLDLAEVIRTHAGNLPLVVCANLPYYITSPILMHLLESRLPFHSITVLVQKEAAQRLCATPGTRECGAISLAVSYFAKPEILFSVSRGSFMPAPNVDSSVIRLQLRKEPPCKLSDETLFFRLIRAAFQQRRKTLSNSLCNAGYAKTLVRDILVKVGLSPSSRAEELTLEQFADLTNEFYQVQKRTDS